MKKGKKKILQIKADKNPKTRPICFGKIRRITNSKITPPKHPKLIFTHFGSSFNFFIAIDLVSIPKDFRKELYLISQILQTPNQIYLYSCLLKILLGTNHSKHQHLKFLF